MKYLKSYNESIKDYLKPKSEDEIKKAMKNLEGLSPSDRINYILENNLLFLFSKDEVKELLSTVDPEEQIDHIFEFGLNKDMYSEDEIKEIVCKSNNFDQITIIYNWGLAEHLFSKDYVKNLVYNSSEIPYEQLDTIYNRFSDELNGIFTDEDIKNIINSNKDNMDKISCIGEFGLGDLFTGDELKDIIYGIEDPYEKLNCMYTYEVNEYFKPEEILKMFKKLSDEEKTKILQFDDLLILLPNEITEKYI